LQNAGLVDRVILSTWTSELLKIPHLLPQLRAAGVMVTSVDEPEGSWYVPGNMMNQMRGIDLALETVEDSAWVLRARPDVMVELELVANLAATDMTLDPSHVGGALNYKIWTPFVEFCTPMCISDIVYFAHYSDIVKLQNFDFFHEVANTHLGTAPGFRPIACYDAEIRRFAPAFHAAYPVISEYYRIYNRFFLGVYELRRAMLTMLFGEGIYWQYIAAYVDILNKYFLIGQDVIKSHVSLVRPESFDQTEWLSCLNLVGCHYAERALAQDPDAASTLELFVEAPLYCKSSGEVKGVAEHLRRIGIPLDQGLEDAVGYRKDGARIAALRGFHERLNYSINNGINRDRTKTADWARPFTIHFFGIPKMEEAT
jgi:hypothetical protein